MTSSSFRKTGLKARLLRDVAGVPAGTVGDVVDAIQGNSLLIKFSNRAEPILVWHEHAECFRDKPVD